ncbi:MAG: endopeptidase La [Epsilonproteobacteria bacterium]|nr:endopeptidase La [Campylobacterota bacterium]
MEESVKRDAFSLLPVLPLKNLVALPKSIVPVVVGREISIKAVDQAMRGNKELFVTAQKSSDTETPTGEDIYEYGTRSLILQVARMPNGTLKILIEGISRCRFVHTQEQDGYLSAYVEDLQTIQDLGDAQRAALWRNLFNLFKEYVNLNEKISSDVLTLCKEIGELDYLTDTIAVQMQLDFAQRQKVLELIDLKDRALHLSILLQKELEILKAEKNIRKRVQSQVEKHQKDYYLNEQMRAIQRELGREDYHQEIEDLRKKAKRLKLSKEALEKVDAELKRLEQMQPTSPEASVSRNYVDWLLSVPWHKMSKDTVSMDSAEEILDSTHFGMQKAKDRIIEFIGTKKFAGSRLRRSPIICLVGPPGVGKTSLADSIAKALGRPMVRISLGGVRDEAEVRGHRRTYIGAMPGKIIQAMKKVKTMNPVILLDEVDKMAMDFRGDPAAALLEVLDPEQNRSFVDHFLEVEYDLSKVMFITTANMVEGIPYPLLDRMEMVSLSGYTDHEKLQIAKKFLFPKMLKEYCLDKINVEISDKLLAKIIDEYTKEAGVRQLERVIAKILRKGILGILKKKSTKTVKKITLDQELVEKWLGVPHYRKDEQERTSTVGVATGLAWTEVGGDLLEIEVTVLKGKGGLTLTGQLGEVMQESAQAAMSYIRSRAKDLGLKESFYSDLDVHLHIPEGAIPKDGPSAGITISTALTSAFTQIPVRHDVAMTGEVTLRGRVLQIGGLKEKLLAAQRFGIKKVLVPKSNKKDVAEFANELDKSLEVVYVDHMDQVLKHALAESVKVKAKTTRAKSRTATKAKTKKKK